MKKGWEIFLPFRRQFATILVLNLLTQTTWQAAPYLFGKMVNGMQEGRSFGYTATLIGLSFLGWMIGLGLSRIRGLYQESHLEYHIERYLSNMALGKYLDLSLGQHRSQSSGITQSVVNKGRTSLEQLAYMVLNDVLPLVTGVTITVVALSWFNPRAGLIVVICIICFAFLSVKHNLKHYPTIRRYNRSGDEINRHFGELLRNVSVVQLNSQEKRVHEEHNDRLEKWGEEGQKVWIPYIKGAIPYFVLLFAFRGAIYLLAAYMVYREAYLIGDAVITITWGNQATNDLWQIAPLQRRWLDLWAKVKRYFAVLDVIPAIRIVNNPIPADNLKGKIEFRNVSYAYSDQRYVPEEEGEVIKKVSGAQPPALIDVSFTVNPGERVAFVGRSGAGKSTLLFLLSRGDDPTNGQVLIDNNDLRLLDYRQFRKSLGVVEQHVLLFDQTLRYNMLFGLNGRGSSITDNEMKRLAEVSRIDMFRDRLTEGWDTKIGENGLQLSGGERQRVSIARALAKESRILLLDEATSSLDGENERRIKEAIHNASAGRTAIIIAHRLSTVRDADRIFVMDKGRIVAQGKHEELCTHSPVYRQLVEDQLVSL